MRVIRQASYLPDLSVSFQLPKRILVSICPNNLVRRLPCRSVRFEGLRGKCGVEVMKFENRSTKKGRSITLKMIVMPTSGIKREADPFAHIAWGQGRATEDAPGLDKRSHRFASGAICVYGPAADGWIESA